MRRGPAGRRLPPMPDADHLHLELRLDLGAWPVPVGSLRDALGHEQAFSGFLGFAAALEAMAGRVPDAPIHSQEA